METTPDPSRQSKGHWRRWNQSALDMTPQRPSLSRFRVRGPVVGLRRTKKETQKLETRALIESHATRRTPCAFNDLSASSPGFILGVSEGRAGDENELLSCLPVPVSCCCLVLLSSVRRWRHPYKAQKHLERQKSNEKINRLEGRCCFFLPTRGLATCGLIRSSIQSMSK